MYDLLFSCSAETLNQFGREKRWLGAENHINNYKFEDANNLLIDLIKNIKQES